MVVEVASGTRCCDSLMDVCEHALLAGKVVDICLTHTAALQRNETLLNATGPLFHDKRCESLTHLG